VYPHTLFAAAEFSKRAPGHKNLDATMPGAPILSAEETETARSLRASVKARIPTDVLTAIAPVIMLEHADMERGNPVSLARVLQSLPISAGLPSNTSVNNGV
jgi:hypothetical protein